MNDPKSIVERHERPAERAERARAVEAGLRRPDWPGNSGWRPLRALLPVRVSGSHQIQQFLLEWMPSFL